MFAIGGIKNYKSGLPSPGPGDLPSCQFHFNPNKVYLIQQLESLWRLDRALNTHTGSCFYYSLQHKVHKKEKWVPQQ